MYCVVPPTKPWTKLFPYKSFAITFLRANLGSRNAQGHMIIVCLSFSPLLPVNLQLDDVIGDRVAKQKVLLKEPMSQYIRFLSTIFL